MPIERDRNGDDRDDRRAPALQEQEHDADHQQDRDEDGDDDLLDRFADEDRRIVDDRVGKAGREILRQGLHRSTGPRARPASEFAPGCAKISSGSARSAVREGGRSVIGGADLDASDVAQARHPSLGVGFENDVGELLGR